MFPSFFCMARSALLRTTKPPKLQRIVNDEHSRSNSQSASAVYRAEAQTKKAAKKQPQAGTSTAIPRMMFIRHHSLASSTLPSAPSRFLIAFKRPIALGPHSICPTLNISPNMYSAKHAQLSCSRSATGKLAIAVAQVRG